MLFVGQQQQLIKQQMDVRPNLRNNNNTLNVSQRKKNFFINPQNNNNPTLRKKLATNNVSFLIFCSKLKFNVVGLLIAIIIVLFYFLK